MRLSKDILSILVCPKSKQALRLLSEEQIQAINSNIASGSVKTVSGTLVDCALDAGLMREDETLVYPIRNDIPILLHDEAIVLIDQILRDRDISG